MSGGYWADAVVKKKSWRAARSSSFLAVGRAEPDFAEGFITREERRVMIEKAAANYRKAVEGVGQGT